MSSNIEISLIICTCNRVDMLYDLLESIDAQSLDKSRFEVLLIDQSDDDKAKDLVKDCKWINYTKLDSKGVSISRNKGIATAAGEILVFIDDDVLLGEKYLEEILNFFKTSELKPDMIGGKTLIDFIGKKPDWLSGRLLEVLAASDFGDEPKYYSEHPKHVPYTCNMAIKKSCAQKVGGFSELISKLDLKIAVNDDVIFANQVRQAGYNLVYNPNMLVYHRMPAARLTYDYYKKKYFSHGRSDAYAYYLLGMYKFKDIFGKLFLHSKRLLEGFILQFFKKDLTEKYYQNLRIYYNAGFLAALFDLLKKKGKTTL